MADGYVRRNGILRPDYSQDITDGLAAWWPLNERGGLTALDISGKNNHGTLTSGPVWAGGGLSFDGTNDYVSAPNLSVSAGFTISAWVNKRSTGVQTVTGQANAGVTSASFYLRINGNSGFSTGGTFKEIVVPDLSLNTWRHVALNYDGANLRYYLNGALAAGPTAATGNVDNPASSFAIGRLGAFDGQYWNGVINNLYIFNRALSALEVQQLCINPNIGLWVPDTKRYYVAAAGAYFLNADPASFGITGAAAGAVAGRMVAADAGAYALTGFNSATLAGRAIAADPASYAITGVPAGVIADRVIDAAPASFSITGIDAGILAGRALSADPGALVITGAAADLVHTATGAFSLNADPGVFSVTGSTAGTIAGRVIDALAGGYAVTGLSASIVAGRALSADPAAYTITGANAGVLAGRVIAAEPGVYAVTGASAAAIAARLLAADTGAYVITGLAATFATGLGVQTFAAQILIMSDAREIIIIDDAREIVVN